MNDSEARLLRLVDALPVLVWMAQPNGDVDFFNKAIQDITGEDIEGLRAPNGWLRLVHEDDRAYCMERWQRALALGEDHQVRFRLRCRDGTYRWHITKSTTLRDAQGQVLRWLGSAVDIHEQKLLEEQARELAGRLASTLESISDAFLILDEPGQVVFANSRAGELLRQSRQALLGRNLAALVGGDIGTLLMQQAGMALDSGRPRLHELFHPGLSRWLECHHYPTEQGTALSIKDITERKRTSLIHRAESEAMGLIASEATLSEVLNCILQGIEQVMPGSLASVVLLDEDGRHIRPGAAPSLPASFAASVDGLEIGPAVGSCGTALYLKRAVIVSDIANDPLWAAARDLALAHELRACWSNPVLDAGGNPLASFAIYYRQVRHPSELDWALVTRTTHLVGLAITRHRQTQALRSSEERFRQLAESIQDVFWMTTLDKSRMLYVSPAFEAIWGIPCADLYENPSTWQNALHPDDKHRVLQGLARQPEGDYEVEYRIRRADGEVRWIADKSFLVSDDQGQPYRLVGVARDITRQRLLERQLQQSQRMEAIGQLTGGVAHDFNNLLTVILGNADLLASELGQLPRQQQAARMIADAAQHGAALTQRMLAFARRQPLDPQPVQLAQLLAQMRPMLERTLGGRIRVQISMASALWPALADPAQLESAILNLCLNARDAMPNGGDLHIQAGNHQLAQSDPARPPELPAGPYVSLRVVDKGEGIAPAHLDRIFEPFFTTKGVGKGSGLGLAMVFGFIKQSNGHVSVESALGQGTSICLLLPRAEQSAVVPAAPAAIPSAGGRAELVLLVEDEAMVRQYAVHQLESLGYRVLPAADAPQALALLQAHPEVDLLFTDLQMPGLDGAGLAQAARQINPWLRVLFTTGYADQQRSQLPAHSQVLHKPYRREELMRKLRLVLDS